VIGDHRTRMYRLVSAELFKLRRRPMLWIMLAIQAALCAVIPMIIYLIVVVFGSPRDTMSSSMQEIANDRLSFPGTLITTVSSSLAWGIPLLIILTASACGGEFAWGTLRLLLSRGEGRGEYCHTKVAALFLVWSILFGSGIVVALLFGALATALADGNGFTTIGMADIGTFVGRIFGGLLAGLTYVALTALITTQTRSTAVAVAGGLVAFFGDRFVGTAVMGLGFRPIELLFRSGVAFNVGSLTGDSGNTSNPVFLSVVVLLMYCTAFVVAMTRLVRRMDITVSGVG
jgi:ABC-2 type transport system permease protein